jgi:uncharacterized protein YfbU (UPF0304 family)
MAFYGVLYRDSHTESTVRPADVQAVVDIMSMWTFIELAIKNLSPDELEKVKAANFGTAPKFIGFDGNNEGPDAA